MSIRFEDLTAGPLHKFNATAPEGAFIGLIGHGESGIAELLAHSGDGALTMGNLSALELPARLRFLQAANEAVRRGQTVLAASADAALLRELADEVWWLEGGQLRGKGDPAETIAAYTASVLGDLRAQLVAAELHPSLRRGDGRASLESVEVLDAGGQPVALLQSGAEAAVRVKVRFAAAVENPVIGIMIRTRIGFEVYGTNTELERLAVGPVAAGELRTVVFRFGCALCPQSYTVTAASHDPDGTWHDWMEDAISFAVADTRYTAGVANLRAVVSLEG
jgi:hypothetical protein